MQTKLKKNIGFSLALFAFFFLFEPSYALIDALPDLIGYTILCIALINLADINDKIALAFRGFRKGVALSAFRIAAVIVLDNIFAEGEQSVGQLLFVFVFAILEFVVVIPAYKAFFEGLLTLGMFEGGDAVYYKKRDGGKNATEKMYSLTLFFLIFKNIVCALPEFTSLQSNRSYEFVGVVRILAIIIVLPVSLAWLAHMLNYITRIKKDTVFISALSEKYLSKATQAPDFFTCRSLTLALYAVLISLVFSFDFFVENINILPDLMFYGAMLILSVFLRKEIKFGAGIVVFSSLGAILSLAASIVEKSFFSMFTIEAVIKNLEAYNQYHLLVCLYTIENIVFVLFSCCLIKTICGVFDRYIAAKHDEGDLYIKEHGRALKIRAFICLTISVLTAASSTYRVVSLKYHDVSWIFYYSGIITSVVQLAFVVSAFVFFSYLIGEVKYNYKSSL